MTTDGTSVRLPVMNESHAVGATAELYAEMRAHFGFGLVPDVFKLVSTRPEFLKVFWDGYRSIFSDGLLDREVKELIAAFVAREVSCSYCVDAHVLFLHLVSADPSLEESLRCSDIDDMPLPQSTRVLLHLARAITHQAYRITDDDFERARRLGWSDAQLLEAVWTACQFNWVARMVNTAGLSSLGQLAE
ncbi:carboxymuconolactone decarboxylase family protein [Streptosporangium sp. CA-115845]|uniref:carboxymuconolactone decarboxylase family protein n=1 Tax=Streptosporangium sp. CA-115845 TaxID=3240071 RepID=UPI003D8A8AB2